VSFSERSLSEDKKDSDLAKDSTPESQLKLPNDSDSTKFIFSKNALALELDSEQKARVRTNAIFRA
jgi:hypothetical protein